MKLSLEGRNETSLEELNGTSLRLSRKDEMEHYHQSNLGKTKLDIIKLRRSKWDIIKLAHSFRSNCKEADFWPVGRSAHVPSRQLRFHFDLYWPEVYSTLTNPISVVTVHADWCEINQRHLKSSSTQLTAPPNVLTERECAFLAVQIPFYSEMTRKSTRL